MRYRFGVWCALGQGLLLGLFLVGCASTRQAAPIRDVRATKPKVEAKADVKAEMVRPVAMSAPVPAGFYRIQPGDTLYKIAFEFNLDFQALAEWNRLATPDRIIAGELLRVITPVTAAVSPAVTQPKTLVTTQAVALPHKIDMRPLPAWPSPPPASAPIAGAIATAIRPAVQLPGSSLPQPEATPDRWDWPSKGTLLARFGSGLSKGIDIVGERGQPVQAAASGTVAYIGAGLRGYGKLIIIRHGKTLLSAYAHHARILVKEGESVGRGQVIGEMGDSDADRVKLHFEIREFGKPVDPLEYLPRQG